MKAKALRLPEDLLDVVKFAEKKEKIDEPTTLRKFLRLGAEKYVSDSYARGDISLREAADILDITTRETLELFWDAGIHGSAGAEETLKAISTVEKKVAKR
ncbi:MAG: hypothetical protein HY279_00040 [Nitrospinae bacterium]|nr:hypothetical protein [Nitrospinota bacterium]